MAVSAVKKESAGAPEAANSPVSEGKPKVPKRKLLIPLVVLFVIVATGGGAYWYSTQDHGSTPHEATSPPPKPPLFVPLEQFTVNLQVEDHPQFLQIGLTLKIADNAVADALKLYMPEVRDRILLLLSSRKASQLLTLDGKQRLSADIVVAINTVLAPANLKLAPENPAPAETAPTEATSAEAAAAGGDGTPDGPTGTEKPAPEGAPAAAENTKPESNPGRAVLSVLFTSFIVQ